MQLRPADRNSAGPELPPEVMNLLDTRPARRCRWRRNDRGNVVLEVARFHKPWSKRLAHFFDLKSRRTVQLDERGSAVWTLCDGKRTIDEIGEVLRLRFGPDEMLYPRLGEFFSLLEANGLIELKAGPAQGGRV